MPREARIYSEFLHVIIRGVGKQILFENDEDRYHFLKLIKNFSAEQKIVLIAYCLMENHVHFLVEDEFEHISIFMKKIEVSYAAYYNRKYERVGHLFQGRYRSEVITDNKYLLAAFRYILLNPEKAGIATAKTYKWSSYTEYGLENAISNTSFIAEMIGSKAELDMFLLNDDGKEFMEDTYIRNDDKWAIETIKSTLDAPSGTALQQMPKHMRDEMIRVLYQKGISIRQIERLTVLTAESSIVQLNY